MTVYHDIMPDTIHATINSALQRFTFIAGYVSGTQDVAWTDADWASLNGKRQIRYYQGFGPVPGLHTFNAIDIEPHGVSPQSAVDIIVQRIGAGLDLTYVYGDDSQLSAFSSLFRQQHPDLWSGHIDCILADWNLSEDQAAALLGTLIHGMTCVGVQWASPTSNPNTFVPGTALTLSAANVDLNVVQADWYPYGEFNPGPPPPPPPPLSAMSGVVVQLPTGTVSDVTSTDGGATWETNH